MFCEQSVHFPEALVMVIAYIRCVLHEPFIIHLAAFDLLFVCDTESIYPVTLIDWRVCGVLYCASCCKCVQGHVN